MKTMENFTRVLFNMLGLCSCKKVNGTLKISRSIALKNIIVLIVLVVTEISLKTLLDISIFLEEGQTLSDFTSFSVVIFRIIAIAPILTASIILFHQQLRQREILNLLNQLKYFNQNFVAFAKCEEFSKRVGIFALLVFSYMTILKTFETFLMVKWNAWVTLTYLLRFYNEYVIAMFFLTLSLFIKYASFLLENLNTKLIQCISQKNFDLEKLSEYYEYIWKLMNCFHRIFHRQMSVFIFFIVIKIVLMVSLLLSFYTLKEIRHQQCRLLRNSQLLAYFSCFCAALTWRQQISSFQLGWHSSTRWLNYLYLFFIHARHLGSMWVYKRDFNFDANISI